LGKDGKAFWFYGGLVRRQRGLGKKKEILDSITGFKGTGIRFAKLHLRKMEVLLKNWFSVFSQ